jgi:hypothetical protein
VADTIASTDVFNFVALRPPTPPKPTEEQLAFIRDARPAAETPVGSMVAELPPKTAGDIEPRIRRLIAEKGYSLEYPQGSGDSRLSNIDSAVAGVPSDRVSSANLRAAVDEALGERIDWFYERAVAEQLPTIWDAYYGFLILSRFEPQNLDQLTGNLRVFHLLGLLVGEVAIPDEATLATVRAATPLLDPLFTKLPKPTPPPPEQPLSRLDEYKKLWANALDTNAALQEVRALKYEAQSSTTTEEIEIPDTATGRTVRSKVTNSQLTTRVDPAGIAALRPQTKALLADAGIAEKNLRVPDAVNALTSRLTDLTSRLSMANNPDVLTAMPPQATELRSFANLVDASAIVANLPHVIGGNVRASIKPLGIGDLKVVKQTLKKYATGEVAHIENVLRGEYKERKYRELDRTEQTVTIETSTEQETTKDTQTTERFELKKESENTIQEQMSVQAGVTVSASYGPVTLGAHGDFAYSTSSSQSEKAASNYAREVVDRSVSRIQTKTRQEQVTTTLHEVEEIDTHGIDNKGQADNVVGVYRWVDKYYEAQIYNYGKRMMFEFIVPEPAAFYGFAQTHQPKGPITGPKPLGSVTHKDINEGNYQKYIRDYGVQGCTPPPPEYTEISMSLSSDAKIENATPLSKSSKDLVVPQGYVADVLDASLSFIYQYFPQFKLSVGIDDVSYSWTDKTSHQRADWASSSSATATYDGIIPVSMDCYDVNAYFVNVVVSCKRTSEKYETWQIQTYEKIVAAYQALQAAYEQKVTAQSSQDIVAIHGQNPGINREIEKNELKKQCVELLLDTWVFGSFDAMKQATPDDAPDMDIFDAIDEGKEIQFFEQAFEWENITYLFYPYFWGRRDQWVSKLTTYDDDPLFTKFLQAGSARVVVPVHPAYNDTVMYFLEHNGEIWQGGDPPRLDDPLFISLADELRDQTDDLQNATPEGDPWEVVLPTTLVYLQQDSTLPTYN